MICEYAVDKQTQVHKFSICTITNSYCPYTRWCDEKKELVMQNGYNRNGCVVKNSMNNKKETKVKETEVESIDSTTPKKTTRKKYSTIEAKVNFSKPSRNKTQVSYFDGTQNKAMFISGIYENKVLIKFSGESIEKGEIIQIQEV